MAVVTQPVILPSRGILYNGKVPDGKVEIKKMTADELVALESTGLSALERIDRIITNCVTLPVGFDHKALLSTDGMALLLTLRTMTYGPKYQFTYRCKHCGKSVKADVDIAEDLEQHNAPDTLAEPLLLKLPDAGVEVGLKFLRRSDEERVAKNARRVQLQSTDHEDTSSKIRLALLLLSVDGENKTDYAERYRFISTLTAADVVRIGNFVNEQEPGIDTTVFPQCRSCGADNELQMPFDAEFFRPTRL